MKKLLMTLTIMLVSVNVFAFDEDSSEYARDTELKLILASSSGKMTNERKSQCESKYKKVNDQILEIERMLVGTELVALRTRLAFSTDFSPITECRIEIYSFDPSIVINHNRMSKKHLGSRSNRKTACLAEFEKIKADPAVIYSTYSNDFNLGWGHTCSVDYVIVEKK